MDNPEFAAFAWQAIIIWFGLLAAINFVLNRVAEKYELKEMNRDRDNDADAV